MTKPKPLILLILDGFGVRAETSYNAIAHANTPCWDSLQKKYPMTQLDCSGRIVGLPDKQMGNSEVGHMHIGTGRYVPQDFSRVSDAIESGSFFENPALCLAVDQALNNDGTLHILGLLSTGGVHSHINHILAMLELAAKKGLKKVAIHAILDGRDVAPSSAESSLQDLQAKIDQLGVGHIASIVGRFYAMDRDNRWERVQKAHQLIVLGKGEYTAKSAIEGLQAAYQREETDEFVSATAILNAQDEATSMNENDSVVFMNFRADRAREISQAITDTDFSGFERKHNGFQGCYVTLTEYHEKFTYSAAYPAIEIKNSLGEVLAQQGLLQLRLAETEKYAHVTFFMNGGEEEPNVGEDRILVPSPKVKTYDLQPEMHAEKVTEHLVNAINEQKYDVIICNYSNCDMVGHTGKWEAALKAVETIDASLAELVTALEKVGGQMLLTADHGNIEQMRDTQGGPLTSHTTNPVPLVYVGGHQPLADGGSLKDLAPTMLAILGIQQPVEMDGKSLLVAS
ncbi:2,3-bisphosphoglycerate-independent phosphoglycerate mutase [Bathymodiolus japonicus methanotrophic gill symbiont]|uniref:2,3-bisphosphoglycerate-independent phosphoglycerate mutase n=1 Tax=Bathymodiolus japonicus methanotrophic gill symbiont TaxID=113269 RepID=UPI001B5A590A|nr:2,3-bisphosphoglycerate-independent phosphoglycerate mutase [Bathymodiolus japonicus methanotrophic gill symbiont]GFO71896.1 2,3-bisphosphoglycerate-independent phosphoglycerate mutase [Bathymodiolus japonicus methanotrophic gill symbiont]